MSASNPHAGVGSYGCDDCGQRFPWTNHEMAQAWRARESHVCRPTVASKMISIEAVFGLQTALTHQQYQINNLRHTIRGLILALLIVSLVVAIYVI